jgi:hypothetical protein
MPRVFNKQLIELGYVQDGDTVRYVDGDTGQQLLSGKITMAGILVANERKPVSPDKFQALAGRYQVKAPTKHIILPNGVSMADALSEIKRLSTRQDLVEKRVAASRMAGSARPRPPTRRSDDSNDDFCGVCQEEGDLLMCDGCRLSFHGGCIGYQDLGFLPEDEDWLCWNCSKRLGKEFVVDARPLDPGRVPNVVFVAVNDSLEYYYKFNVVRKKGKRGRRLAVTLRTGPDAERDVIETTFDVEDRKIWRGDLSRNTTNGWVVPVEPLPNTDLTRHPVPHVPRFHCVTEPGHPVATIPPPPLLSSTKTRNSKKAAERNAQDMIEVADILSQFASIDANRGGTDVALPGSKAKEHAKKRRAVSSEGQPGGGGSKVREIARAANPAEMAGAPSQLKMTEAALKLDVDDDVEVWISETSVGPGGWVPGKVVERALIEEDGSGAPYFAFYSVEMRPLLEHPIDLTSEHSVMRPMLRVRRPLAVPVGNQRYANMVRKPLTAEEQRPAGCLRKGDRVEAIVCGRFAPGTISKDTGPRSSTCRIKFDNPAKGMGYKAATATQPLDAVRLTSLPAQYHGMLR